MAIAKTDLFEKDMVQLAAWAKALSHPARVAILKILMKRESCVCGTLVDVLPLSQATVSQHLKELKKAGFIQGRVDGPRVCYCINQSVWKQASDALQEFFTYNEKSPNCC